MKHSFLSPNLRYSNGLIYYLNIDDIDIENYKENNYYIEMKDIKINDKLNDNVNYNIVYSNFDDNIVIEFDLNDEINKEDTLEYMYRIQEKIKGIDDSLIDEGYTKDKEKFKKYENNIIF